MSPGSRSLLASALVVALVAAACGGSSATFSPSGPCAADGRSAGAYPQLEALLPLDVEDGKPTTIDSGRSCTRSALGALVQHGVSELRFAGATWDHGGGRAETVALFALPDRPIEAAWMEEFYQAGAAAGRNTDRITTDRPTIGGRPVFRLQTLNSLSYQTVVVWKDGAIVRVVLAAIQLGPSTTKAEQDAYVVRLVEGVMRMAPPQPSAVPSA